MTEGHAPAQPYVVVQAGSPARLPGRARVVAAALLAALGVSAAAGAFVALGTAVSRSVRPLREASTSAQAQWFTFDRAAWRGVAVDDVFPPVYHTFAKEPMAGATRDYTRIGVAPVADCRAAFDPALARLLSSRPCGPVLRADYTDATRTMVATVGLSILGTEPPDQQELNAATIGHHDDLRPRAVAFAGTPAAGFGDAQRVAFQVLASPTAPVLDFAVVGFSDGRPATAVPGADAVDQSGAEDTAVDLGDMVDARMEHALSDLWKRHQ
jgi:hypothetical protein